MKPTRSTDLSARHVAAPVPAGARRPCRTAALAVLVAGTTAVASACGSEVELAYGDLSSIVTVAQPGLWSEVRDTVESALEPTVLTVRDERTFQVTHASPEHPRFAQYFKFRQLLIIGTEEDSWVRTAMDERRRGEGALSPPAVFQVGDVWARNQQVTVALLPTEGDREAALASLLDELRSLYDQQYRQWARNRMYVSGRDTALADTLATQVGFSLLLPAVYKWDTRDSIYVFRNDNPDPSELIRQINVTWEPMPPDPEGALTTGRILEWRQAIGARAHSVGQLVDSSRIETTTMRFREDPAAQVQGTWQNPPEANWPAAGPFVTRAIACRDQDRLYLVDSWLYAPGREKYEYMLQLETILNSFRCDGQPAREPSLNSMMVDAGEGGGSGS